MKKEIYDSMTDEKLSPFDFITLMFERTDEDGILYVPDLYPEYSEEAVSYRCKMDWNLAKYEKTLEKFRRLYASIERCAAHYAALEEASADAGAILGRGDAEVWHTYIRSLTDATFDSERYDEIKEHLESIASTKQIAAKVARGEPLDNYEKGYLAENVDDLTVGEEDLKFYDEYYERMFQNAKNRVGRNICSYELCIAARRLCCLLSIRAPKLVNDNEARFLAEAFVLHECCISREIVGDSVRLRLEELEQMSEEELDELYRPQRVNSRKSLAPLFVYEILCRKSDSRHHLRQQEILKELAAYPYEISLERKALGRILHNLLDSSQYAVFSDKTGVWVDQEKCRETIVK